MGSLESARAMGRRWVAPSAASDPEAVDRAASRGLAAAGRALAIRAAGLREAVAGSWVCDEQSTGQPPRAAMHEGLTCQMPTCLQAASVSSLQAAFRAQRRWKRYPQIHGIHGTRSVSDLARLDVAPGATEVAHKLAAKRPPAGPSSEFRESRESVDLGECVQPNRIAQSRSPTPRGLEAREGLVPGRGARSARRRA